MSVLFAVPEESFARYFADVAASMPDVKSAMVAGSWSAAYVLWRRGLRASCVPCRSATASDPINTPRVAELAIRGYTEGSVPRRVKRWFGIAAEFVDGELVRTHPDVVVHGPIENAICRVVQERAARRGIPTLGVQASFLADHFIIHSQGDRWEQHLRAVTASVATCRERPACGWAPVARPRRPAGATGLRTVTRALRGAERVFRVAYGGASFDTPGSLGCSVLSAVRPRRWFPRLATLSRQDLTRAHAVVAVHQPALAWGAPTWVDLVEFALRATPEHVTLVVRPHPAEPAQRLPPGLEKALAEREVRVSRAGAGPALQDLLRSATAVFTLSSAVGVDALRAGIPVFALGPALYAAPGLAVEVSVGDADHVRAAIAAGSLSQPRVADVDRFVASIVRESSVPSSVGQAAHDDLATRIRHLRYEVRAA